MSKPGMKFVLRRYAKGIFFRVDFIVRLPDLACHCIDVVHEHALLILPTWVGLSVAEGIRRKLPV